MLRTRKKLQDKQEDSEQHREEKIDDNDKAHEVVKWCAVLKEQYSKLTIAQLWVIAESYGNIEQCKNDDTDDRRIP